MPSSRRATIQAGAVIRRATKADLAAIHTWLQDEDARGVPGNFLCNWYVIEKAQRERSLYVDIDPKTAQPIAFQIGGLIAPGILAVRAEYRRTGIGRQFVEHLIKAADRQRRPVLRIQCKPSSSIPFWRRMGFVRCKGSPDDNNYYLVIPHRLKNPKGAIPVKVAIRFYTEKRKGNTSIPPCEIHEVDAFRDDNGVIHLSERVTFAAVVYPNVRDALVEIMVDGQSIYFDKAKYPQAAAIGVEICPNGYFIDAITLDAGR